VKDLPGEHRRLCSDLIDIKWKNSKGKKLVYPGLLEEIAPTSACVQLDFPIPLDSHVRLECRRVAYAGVISTCSYEQNLGYFVSIEFEKGERWSPDQYEPRYCIDPLELCSKQQWPPRSEADIVEPCGPGGCVREICPREIVALAIDPSVRLRETVQSVAGEVAVLCGELDEMGLLRCFGRLFRIGPDCTLTREFIRQYRETRERLRHREDPKLDAMERIQSIARMLAGVPKEALGYRGQPPGLT